MQTVTYIPADKPMPDADRVRRLRGIAWLLDNSIALPGGYRIGIDAVIGLVPGIGDAIGALLSAYILNEARSLGVPRSVLMRMAGNVIVETIIGSIPLAGDLFDAAFKANMRNIALLERYHVDPAGAKRNGRWFVAGFSILLVILVAAMVAIPVLLIAGLVKLF